MKYTDNEIYNPVPAVDHIISFVVQGDHLEIQHDGDAGWCHLQTIKNMVWGEHVGAKEYYPPEKYVVNGQSTTFHFRHLWKMTANENWINLREHDEN